MFSSVKVHTAGKMKQHTGNASAQQSPLGPHPGFLSRAYYLGSFCQGVSKFRTPEGKQVLSISHSLHGVGTVSPPLPVNCRLGDALSTKFPDTSLRPAALLTPRYIDDKPFKFIEWCASVSSSISVMEVCVFVQIL